MRDEAHAIREIREELGLPPGDGYTQDWVHELAEPYRTSSWLNRYLDSLEVAGRSRSARLALMSLVLDVSNDLAGMGVLGSQQWARARRQLEENSALYAEQIEYWALRGEPVEDGFAITPLMREVADSTSR